MWLIRTRYSSAAIGLHWLIAVAILFNIWLGWRMGHATGLAQFGLFQLHKSVGVSVLLLSFVRLGWRLAHRPPALPDHMGAAERRIAQGVHVAFYTLMIVLPLTGWVVVSVSAYNLPTLLFGTVPWPHIAPLHDLPMESRSAIETRMGAIHAWLAWTLLAMVVLHVAAALKHHLVDRDDVLARMLPLLRPTVSSKRL